MAKAMSTSGQPLAGAEGDAALFGGLLAATQAPADGAAMPAEDDQAQDAGPLAPAGLPAFSAPTPPATQPIIPDAPTDALIQPAPALQDGQEAAQVAPERQGTTEFADLLPAPAPMAQAQPEAPEQANLAPSPPGQPQAVPAAAAAAPSAQPVAAQAGLTATVSAPVAEPAPVAPDQPQAVAATPQDTAPNKPALASQPPAPAAVLASPEAATSAEAPVEASIVLPDAKAAGAVEPNRQPTVPPVPGLNLAPAAAPVLRKADISHDTVPPVTTDAGSEVEADAAPAPALAAVAKPAGHERAAPLPTTALPPEARAQAQPAAAEDRAAKADQAVSMAASTAETQTGSSAGSQPAPSHNLASALQAQLQSARTAPAAPVPDQMAEADPLIRVSGSAGQPAGAAPQAEAASWSPSGLAQATVETTALISAQILKRLDSRTTRFDMALTPEGLGRVDISLEIDGDGHVQARLAFDNPAAATDLRGRADELRRQLLDAGLQLSRDGLEFAERDPSSGSGGGAFDRQPDRRAFAGANRLAEEADIAAAAQPAAWTTLSLTPDRVDVKV